MNAKMKRTDKEKAETERRRNLPRNRECMDPEKVHHCEFDHCIRLANIGIADVWVCDRHIEWAMDLAFRPLEDARRRARVDLLVERNT